MAEDSKPKGSKKAKKEAHEEEQSVQDSMRNVADELADLIGKNQVDAIAYACLLVGLILSYWHALIGGIIVGIVVGIYFASELLGAVAKVNDYIDEFGPFKSLMGVTAILFLVWASPYMFVGLAATVAIRSILDHRK